MLAMAGSDWVKAQRMPAKLWPATRPCHHPHLLGADGFQENATALEFLTEAGKEFKKRKMHIVLTFFFITFTHISYILIYIKIKTKKNPTKKFELLSSYIGS